jgi:glycosidase
MRRRRSRGFIGRQAAQPDELVGVDAALEFPLFFQLPGVVTGFTSPQAIERVYRQRKDVQRNLLTPHGEASSHFVTFLDNPDMRERISFRDAAAPARFDDQLVLGLVLLLTLQGTPCLYYGTEQGLAGRGSSDQAVREALWGRPGGSTRPIASIRPYAGWRPYAESSPRSATAASTSGPSPATAPTSGSQPSRPGSSRSRGS